MHANALGVPLAAAAAVAATPSLTASDRDVGDGFNPRRELRQRMLIIQCRLLV